MAQDRDRRGTRTTQRGTSTSGRAGVRTSSSSSARSARATNDATRDERLESARDAGTTDLSATGAAGTMEPPAGSGIAGSSAEPSPASGRYWSRAQDRLTHGRGAPLSGYGVSTGYSGASGYGAAHDRDVDRGEWGDRERTRPIADLGDRNPSQGFGAPREGGALRSDTDYPRARETADRSWHGGESASAREGRRRWRREPLLAREIMTKNPSCARPESDLREVARIMKDENTGVVPVVDDRGRLQGLVTDRDIVMRSLAEGEDPQRLRARDVMTDDVEAVTPDESVLDVVRLMGDKQIRRIPVVDRDDVVVGIISMADVATRADYDTDLQDALEEISSKRSFWGKLFS